MKKQIEEDFLSLSFINNSLFLATFQTEFIHLQNILYLKNLKKIKIFQREKREHKKTGYYVDFLFLNIKLLLFEF